MSYTTTPPKHDLFDLHGEKTYPTGVKWYIDQRGFNESYLVFTPTTKLTKDQVSRLRWLYSVIRDREIKVHENGIVTVKINFGEKFGWILGKVASFYRMAKNNGVFSYE